jgi:peptide-methionine (S)-S-oxide reductase
MSTHPIIWEHKVKGLLAFLIGLTALGAAHAADADGSAAKAVLAGGCFWCVEHDFRQLAGVMKVVSGYSGGSLANPTYENYHDVSTANPTPHTDVVEVTYDTAKLSYEQVLDYYFRHVDPTDGGGQFCDRGPAYAPVIFTANDDEKAVATAKKAEVVKLLKTKIAVEIRDAKMFWPAEEYHQDYARKNPLKYQFYRWNCGRDQRIKAVWNSAASQGE